MTTSTTTARAPMWRDPARRWRLAFVAAGVAMAVGGGMHPEADAEDALRDELATMTAGDSWVLSHSLLALGTALLVLGLWSAHRGSAWPRSATRALRTAAIAMSLYLVETVVHLAAVVDSDALADGGAAPVAFLHVGLSVVLYPLSGLALARLGVALFRAVARPEKVFGLVLAAAGLVHATSVPLTIVFPDAELSPAFAGAGMLLAGFAVGTGLTGLRHAGTARAPRLDVALADRGA